MLRARLSKKGSFKMKNYYDIVKEVLQDHPDARDDDFRCFGWVCRKVCPSIMQMPFNMVLWQNKQLGLPSYESITRARRKVQEKCVDLRGKKYQARQDRQADYIAEYGDNYG